MDETFVATPLGEPEIRDGRETYRFVAFHKVVHFNGDTYVCGGIFTSFFVRSEFYKQTRIVASNGGTIKYGLVGFSRFEAPIDQLRIPRTRPPGVTEEEAFIKELWQARIPADVALFKGERADCLRSRRAWRDAWADGRSRFSMPTKIRITE